MTEMCRELTDPGCKLDLLIKTPNAGGEVGLHRDKYLLNGSSLTEAKARHFRFLGKLIGIAVRTGKPITLNLAPIVWKLISNATLDYADLEAVDLHYASSLKNIEGEKSREIGLGL